MLFCHVGSERCLVAHADNGPHDLKRGPEVLKLVRKLRKALGL